MFCPACYELLSLKLDHAITPPQAAKLDKLMQDCPDCQRLWAAMRESDTLLHSAGKSPQTLPDPDAFTATVMRKVAAQNYVLGAHSERDPQRLALAAARARLPKFPWSPGALRPQTIAWVSSGIAASLSIALVTWLWLTSLIPTSTGNETRTTRLDVLQRALAEVGDAINWPLMLGLLIGAALLVAVWLALVSFARRRLGDWEGAE